MSETITITADEYNSLIRASTRACPNCAALEAEVRRLRDDREEARRERNLEAEFRAAAVRQRDLSHRILKELMGALDADSELPRDALEGDRRQRAVEISHAMDAASALLAGIPVVGYEEMEAKANNISRAWSEAVSERDSARTLLAELAAAVRAFRGTHSSPFHPWPERDRLDEVLASAEAEGEGAG